MTVRTALAALLALACSLPATWAAPLPSSLIEHPAVPHMVSDYRLDQEDERTAELVQQAMALGEDQIEQIILPRHGLTPKLVCPECGCQTLDYSLDRPEQIDCPDCGAAITADTLPTDMQVSGSNLLGETVTYELSVVKPGPVGIAATIRYRRHHEMAAAARALAEHYHTSRDEALARRAVQIMSRFAEVYPHWPVFKRGGKHYWREWTIGPPRPWSDWLYGRWTDLFMYEIPQDLVFAYDLTYDAAAWEELAPEGVELRRRIEERLFRPALDFAVTAHTDNGGQIWNLNPTLYQRMIHLGRVLNDPNVVHQAVHFMREMIRVSYHFDGMEYEGTLTYHGLVTWRLAIAARMLRGYHDPAGYTDERYGISLAGGDDPLEMPVYRRAMQITEMMTYPDGNRICVHDTSWGAGRAETPPDAEPANIELNAYGHFALGGGRGPDGMQAHLHFCPRIRGGHFHDDRLQLILWGAGEELLPDVGYVAIGKPHRYFINGPLAHNTVDVLFEDEPEEPEIVEPAELPDDPVGHFRAIAESERPVVYARSRLLAYDPGTVSDGRVQLAAASSPGPEWMGMGRQERHLLMVSVDQRRSYLVDVFRLNGGDRHRFVLRGSADEDVSTDCELPLEPVPGTLAGPDVPYGEVTAGAELYSWLVHDLRRARAEAPWQMTWTGADSGASLRAFFAGQKGSEVTLGMAPTLRRGAQDARLADDYQGPHMLIDRTAGESVFAAVYDCWPKGSTAAVRSVSWRRLGEGADAALALAVRLDGREDIIYCSADRRQRDAFGARFTGPWAVVSRQDGQSRWAWAHDAEVRATDIHLRAEQCAVLPLTAVQRAADGAPADALVVEGEVPDVEELVGQWVRVLLGEDTAYGYNVTAVRSKKGRAVIEIEADPGISVAEDRWELLYNPFFEGDGPCRVELTRSAFVAVRTTDDGRG